MPEAGRLSSLAFALNLGLPSFRPSLPLCLRGRRPFPSSGIGMDKRAIAFGAFGVRGTFETIGVIVVEQKTMDAALEPTEAEILGADEVRALMEMREGVYRLFSSLYFKELTEDQIRFLHDADLDGFEEMSETMAEGAKNIKRAVRRINSGTREDLAVDYAHTFLGAGTTKGESRACPYESVFTSRDGLIMQEARDDVYRYMLNEHLEPNANLRIPDDHLAFVFEFMANLCVRFNEAVAAGDASEARRIYEVQREFFEKHIYSWIGRLCDAIEGCCRTSFYRGVSQMTRGFVEADHEILADMDAAVAA